MMDLQVSNHRNLYFHHHHGHPFYRWGRLERIHRIHLDHHPCHDVLLHGHHGPYPPGRHDDRRGPPASPYSIRHDHVLPRLRHGAHNLCILRRSGSIYNKIDRPLSHRDALLRYRHDARLLHGRRGPYPLRRHEALYRRGRLERMRNNHLEYHPYHDVLLHAHHGLYPRGRHDAHLLHVRRGPYPLLRHVTLYRRGRQERIDNNHLEYHLYRHALHHGRQDARLHGHHGPYPRGYHDGKRGPPANSHSILYILHR